MKRQKRKLSNSEYQKPVELIHIDNRPLTKNQRRLFNILLKHFIDQKKYTDERQEISFFELKNYIKKNKNYNQIIDDFRKVSSIDIEYDLRSEKKRQRNYTRIMSSIELQINNETDTLESIAYYVPKPIRDLVAEKGIYSILDIEKLYELSSKYSIALYENCKRYLQDSKQVSAGWWTLDETKKLIGINGDKDWRYVNYHIIKKALDDINANTDIFLTQEIRKKEGTNKITHIRFLVEQRKQGDLDGMTAWTVITNFFAQELPGISKEHYNFLGSLEAAEKIVNEFFDYLAVAVKDNGLDILHDQDIKKVVDQYTEIQKRIKKSWLFPYPAGLRNYIVKIEDHRNDYDKSKYEQYVYEFIDAVAKKGHTNNRAVLSFIDRHKKVAKEPFDTRCLFPHPGDTAQISS